MLHSGMLRPYPKTLDQASKACQEQTLQLTMKLVTYGRKKFYNIGHRSTNIAIVRTCPSTGTPTSPSPSLTRTTSGRTSRCMSTVPSPVDTTTTDIHLNILKSKISIQYTITIIHRLSIYTSMKHSPLLLKTFSACGPLFRHPVWRQNKSVYASLLIETLSIINPNLACLVFLLSVVNNF